MKKSVDLFTFKVGEGSFQRTFSYPMREVRTLAAELGMDLTQDKEFIWFLKQALVTILPQGWHREKDPKGALQYHNPTTGTTTERHPLLYLFRAAFSRLIQSAYDTTATVSANTPQPRAADSMPVRTHSEQEAFFAELLRKVQRKQEVSDSDRLATAMAEVELFYETLVTGQGVPPSIEDSLEYKCVDPKEILATAAALGIEQDYRLLWIARLFCVLPLPPLWKRSVDAFRNELFINAHYSVSIKHHPSQNFFYKFIQRLKFGSLEEQPATMTFLDTSFHEYEVDLRRLVTGSKDCIIRVSPEPVLNALGQAKFFQKRLKAAETLDDVMALEIAESCGVQLDQEMHLLGVVYSHFAVMKQRIELAGWEFRYSTEGQKYWYHPETQRAMKSYPYKKVLKTAIDDARILFFHRFGQLTKQTGEIHPAFDEKSPQFVADVRQAAVKAMAGYLHNVMEDELKEVQNFTPILLQFDLKTREKAQIQRIFFACPFRFPGERLQDSDLLQLQEGWEVESNMSAMEREDVNDMLEDIKKDVHHMDTLTELIKNRALKGLFMRPKAQNLTSSRKNSKIASASPENIHITPFTATSPEQLRAKSSLASLLSVKPVATETRPRAASRTGQRPSVRVAETLAVPGEMPAVREATRLVREPVGLQEGSGRQKEGGEEGRVRRNSKRRQTSLVKRQSREEAQSSIVTERKERWMPESVVRTGGNDTNAASLEPIISTTEQKASKPEPSPVEPNTSEQLAVSTSRKSEKAEAEFQLPPISLQSAPNLGPTEVPIQPLIASFPVPSPTVNSTPTANPALPAYVPRRVASPPPFSVETSPPFPAPYSPHFESPLSPGPSPLPKDGSPTFPIATLKPHSTTRESARQSAEVNSDPPVSVSTGSQTAVPSSPPLEISTQKPLSPPSAPASVSVPPLKLPLKPSDSPDLAHTADPRLRKESSSSSRDSRRASFSKQKESETSAIHETLKALLAKRTTKGTESAESVKKQSGNSILEGLKCKRANRMAMESDSEESEDSLTCPVPLPQSLETQIPLTTALLLRPSPSIPRKTSTSAPLSPAPTTPSLLPRAPTVVSRPPPRKINLNKNIAGIKPDSSKSVTAPTTPQTLVDSTGRRALLTIMEEPSPQSTPIISRFQAKSRFSTPLLTDRSEKSGFLPRLAWKGGRTERRLEATLRGSKRSISGNWTERKRSFDQPQSSVASLRTSASTYLDPPAAGDSCSEEDCLQHYLLHVGSPFARPDVGKMQPSSGLLPSHVVQMAKRIGLNASMHSFESAESDLFWIPYVQLITPLPTGFPVLPTSTLIFLPLGKHPGDSFFQLMLEYHRPQRRAELTKMSKSQQVLSVVENSWLEFLSPSGHCYLHNCLTGEMRQASSLALLRFGKAVASMQDAKPKKRTYRSQSQKTALAPGSSEDLQSLVRVRRMKQSRELRISL